MPRTAIIGSQFLDRKVTDFNGVDQYAFCDDPSFKGNQQGCFLFRYRPSSLLTANGVKSIIGYGVRDAANNSTFIILQRWNNNTAIAPTWRSQPIPDVVCRTINAGVVSSAHGQHIFAASTWVSWALQSNGSAYQHAINGTLITSPGWQPGNGNNGDWLGDISGSQHRLTIAAQFITNTAQNYSDHRHNEILYINRPLNNTELAWYHNAGVPRNPRRAPFAADIVSWWRMGESRDNDTTIFDEVGPNHLTLVNMSSANYLDV